MRRGLLFSKLCDLLCLSGASKVRGISIRLHPYLLYAVEF